MAGEHGSHASRYGAGEVSESSTSDSAPKRKRETLSLSWAFGTSKPSRSNILPLIRPYFPIPSGSSSATTRGHSVGYLTELGICVDRLNIKPSAIGLYMQATTLGFASFSFFFNLIYVLGVELRSHAFMEGTFLFFHLSSCYLRYLLEWWKLIPSTAKMYMRMK